MAKKNKFNARPTTVEGVTFHSQKEAARYQQLRLLERGGVIRNLETQPKFAIAINGKHCFNYFSDFAYFEGEKRIVEDVKSPITRKDSTYRVKKKVVEAAYGIQIVEV